MKINDIRKFIIDSFVGFRSGDMSLRISEVNKMSFNISITFSLTENENVSRNYIGEILERIGKIEDQFDLKSDFWNGSNYKNSRSQKERRNYFNIGFVFYISEIVSEYRTNVLRDLNSIVIDLRDYHLEDEYNNGEEIKYKVGLNVIESGSLLKSQYELTPHIEVTYSGDFNKKLREDVENQLLSLLLSNDLKMVNKVKETGVHRRINNVIYFIEKDFHRVISK
jgi:hypothetical protein